MKTSEETTNIIKALIKVQAALEPVKKDRANEFASSKYATLDAILEAVLPILSANEIFMTQEPATEIQGNGSVYIGVTTTLFHTSGEFFEYETLWFQLEKGAKMNMAQSSGSVITYIKRYSISAVLGISTDEDKDGIQPVNNQPQQNKPQQQPRNNQSPQQKNERQEAFNLIKEYRKELTQAGKLQDTDEWIAKTENIAEINKVDVGRLVGYYKAACMRLKTAQIKAQQEAQQTQQQPVQTQIEGTGPVRWGQRQ